MKCKPVTWAVILLAGALFPPAVRAAERPGPEAFVVLEQPEPGPRITPLLRHELDIAWQQDDARRAAFAAIRCEADLLALQKRLRQAALDMIGGLPERTPLNAQVVGRVDADGYHIEKLIFESQPGYHVTALLYVPDAPTGRKPAVLVACGHSPLGNETHQTCGTQTKRGRVAEAKAVHYSSEDRSGNLIAINCAALPRKLRRDCSINSAARIF